MDSKRGLLVWPGAETIGDEGQGQPQLRVAQPMDVPAPPCPKVRAPWLSEAPIRWSASTRPSERRMVWAKEWSSPSTCNDVTSLEVRAARIDLPSRVPPAPIIA